MKRKIYLLFAFFALAGVSFAQEFKLQVNNSKENKISLSNFKGELVVEGYEGNEIIITTDKSFSHSDRSKGLKPVYASGTDNTGIGLYYEKNNNEIIVKCLLPITRQAEYKLKIPSNIGLKIHSECAGCGEIKINNLKNEIEIKSCHDIELKNITGPAVVSTISGDVNLIYPSISQDKPISITSISGNVDMTIPEKTPANIELKSVTGEMFTDFELKTDDKSMKQIGGSKVKSKINGGGVDIFLHSVSGNIYLRKGK